MSLSEQSRKDARKWIERQLVNGTRVHELHELIDNTMQSVFNRVNSEERIERNRANQLEFERDLIAAELHELRSGVARLQEVGLLPQPNSGITQH